MTPEELNRTMEFIVASQARMAAAQEQDRQDRLEFQEWSKRIISGLARLQTSQTELLSHQSQRMDRLDKFYENWLKQNSDFQSRALHLLNLILGRLPPNPGKNEQIN